MAAVRDEDVLTRVELAAMVRQAAQERDQYEYDSSRWHYWEARRIRHDRQLATLKERAQEA